MRWTINVTDRYNEFLRFLLRGVFMANGFMAAVFSVWFVAKFLWRLHEYCQRAIFSNPW